MATIKRDKDPERTNEFVNDEMKEPEMGGVENETLDVFPSLQAEPVYGCGMLVANNTASLVYKLLDMYVPEEHNNLDQYDAEEICRENPYFVVSERTEIDGRYTYYTTIDYDANERTVRLWDIYESYEGYAHDQFNDAWLEFEDSKHDILVDGVRITDVDTANKIEEIAKSLDAIGITNISSDLNKDIIREKVRDDLDDMNLYPNIKVMHISPNDRGTLSWWEREYPRAMTEQRGTLYIEGKPSLDELYKTYNYKALKDIAKQIVNADIDKSARPKACAEQNVIGAENLELLKQTREELGLDFDIPSFVDVQKLKELIDNNIERIIDYTNLYVAATEVADKYPELVHYAPRDKELFAKEMLKHEVEIIHDAGDRPSLYEYAVNCYQHSNEWDSLLDNGPYAIDALRRCYEAERAQQEHLNDNIASPKLQEFFDAINESLTPAVLEASDNLVEKDVKDYLEEHPIMPTGATLEEIKQDMMEGKLPISFNKETRQFVAQPSVIEKIKDGAEHEKEARSQESRTPTREKAPMHEKDKDVSH